MHGLRIIHALPQSAVLGHIFAAGFVSGSQLELSQVTVPGVPDLPSPTPHVLAHSCGSPRTQLPDQVDANKAVLRYVLTCVLRSCQNKHPISLNRAQLRVN